MERLASMKQKLKGFFNENNPLLFYSIYLVLMSVMFLVSFQLLSGTSASNGLDELTFYRPVGGEDRQVEYVKLSCNLSDVPGYPDNSLWCQEIIEEEEPR